MSVRASDFIILASMKARYELSKNPTATLELIRKIVERRKEKTSKLETVYHYFPKHHDALFNASVVDKTGGCGCLLCTATAKHTVLNKQYHRFKKGFFDEFNTEYYGNPFQVEYRIHCIKEKENISELEFFELRKREYIEQIQQSRLQLKSIQQTICSLMEI